MQGRSAWAGPLPMALQCALPPSTGAGGRTLPSSLPPLPPPTSPPSLQSTPSAPARPFSP
eukprot:7380575-Prymnesium_polylepis.1